MAKINVKEKILAAGLNAIHHNGFHSTAVQDITTAAGVPKGSFYNHFLSKEALGAEIVERYGFSSMSRQVLFDKSKPAKERLSIYFISLNEMYRGKEYQHGCLLGNMSAELGDSSPMIRERLATAYVDWTTDLATAVRDGQAEGTISNSVSAENLAVFLLDAWEGAVLRARVDKDSRSLDIFLEVGIAKALS